MPSIQGRDTYNYRRLSREHRAACARANAPCWLCGQAIDYALPADDAAAYSTDHVRPLSLHPDLAEDPANFAPAHRRCNEARGNRPPPLTLGTPSRNW
jgi:5-methylcytosine-specific restriction endonuclease McrA